MVSVGYGVVYDYIWESFPPYQALQQEVRTLVEQAVPAGANRRDVRILELACGPGNFSVKLAEAGFSVVGLDRYGTLIDLAREKRQANRLAHLTFQQGDITTRNDFREESFDQVVNIHSLYVHPRPERKLKEAFRVLRPGGHAVFVNHSRRVALGPTVAELRAREGLGSAARSLVWVVPNAIFESARTRVGPTYWEEAEFTANVEAAGFRVIEVRRTFLCAASVLVWATKGAPR
jgi:ubiquinone/menaquinone biosynthesis C-methylase UbiE